MKKKIAIQDFEGSFHQMVAQQYWGNDIDTITCDTFEKVALSVVHHNTCNGGLMTIENSIAGSILPNYSLLRQYELHIIASVYFEVKNNQGYLAKVLTAIAAKGINLRR